MTNEEMHLVLVDAIEQAGSVSELARNLGVTRWTVQRWSQQKGLPIHAHLNAMLARLGRARLAEPVTKFNDLEKWCNDCGKMRPHAEFGANRSAGNGLTSYCKKHMYVRVRPYTWKSQLRAKYGITHHDYDAMRTAQDHRCAICARSEKDLAKPGGKHRRVLHVDHCHATGKVRALLCSRCNIFIGHLENSSALLDKAQRYIAEHASPTAT